MIYTRCIESLERFFKIDIRYFAWGSFWLSLGKVITMGMTFVLSVYYASLIPKEAYGNYRYVLSVLSMGGIFALPGMGAAITRSVARGFEGTYRLAGIRIFLSSFGISIFGLVAGIIFFIKGNTSLGISFLVISLLVPFVEGLGSWRAYYDGIKNFRTKVIATTISQLFYTLTMLMTIFVIAELRIQNIYIPILLIGAYSISNAATNTYFFIRTYRTIPSHAKSEPGALQYGYHLSASGALATIATYLDGVLIFYFLGPRAIATYSFAIALPDQLKAFFTTFADVGFPKIAHHKNIEELKKTLPYKVLKAIFLTGVSVVTYIVAAPYIYNMFFQKYSESVIYSQIFSLSLILFPLGIFGTALKTSSTIRKIYAQNIISSVIQIILLLALIPAYGLWGAIYGRVAGRVINHFVSMYLFMKT